VGVLPVHRDMCICRILTLLGAEMSEPDEAIIPMHNLHRSLKYWLDLRDWYDDYMRRNNLTSDTLSRADRACYETIQACIAREVKRKLNTT